MNNVAFRSRQKKTFGFLYFALVVELQLHRQGGYTYSPEFNNEENLFDVTGLQLQILDCHATTPPVWH